MKVVQLTERYPPAVGGVETHVKHLSQELLKLGLDVRVVTTDLLTTDPLERFQLGTKDAVGEGIQVDRVKAYDLLPLKQGLGLISPGMLRYLRGMDVVHAHGYGHFPTYLAIACRIVRVPFVVTTHSDIGRPSALKKMYDIVVPWLTIKAADEVIAVSKHERATLIQRGVDESKIAVIPNGVDADEFSSFNRTRLAEGAKVIFYAGRVDIDQKGLDVLIRAFAILTRKLHNVKLKLAGPDWSGSTFKLAELAEKLGVKGNLEFLGYQTRERLVSLMRSSDLFVLPSRFEPFGIVLLEALAAEVPIVASRVGGIPEILGHGRFGELFETGNAESLAAAMERVFENSLEAAKKARKGRDSLEKYSWERIAAATQKVYERAILDSRHRSGQMISPASLGANTQ